MSGIGVAIHGVRERRALLALVAGSAAVAAGAIFVRLSDLAPSASGFHRIALALPVFWLWARFERRRQPVARAGMSMPVVGLLGLAGLLFAGDLATYHRAIHYTSVANATLLLNTAPVFVTLGGWLLWRQRISVAFLLGMTIALIGAVMLLFEDLDLAATALWGDVLGIVAGACYGGYLIIVGRLRTRFSTGEILFFSGAANAAALLVLCLFEGIALLPGSLHGWLMVLGLALVTQACGQGLIVHAMAHLPVTFSSLVQILQVVIAAALGWLLLAEALQPLQAAGAVVVLVGIVIARRSSRTAAPVAGL